MSSEALLSRLQQLLELILEERDCAKRLDMAQLTELTRAKESLLQGLPQGEPADAEARALAERIREENRRNAYLLWSTLSWVRETMSFFGSQAVQTGYSQQGGMHGFGNSGMLLSGKV